MTWWSESRLYTRAVTKHEIKNRDRVLPRGGDKLGGSPLGLEWINGNDNDLSDDENPSTSYARSESVLSRIKSDKLSELGKVADKEELV